MSKADDIFIQNCEDILEKGFWDTGLDVRPKWEDGTPAHTVKLFGLVNRYDLREEFPIQTIRKINFRGLVEELLPVDGTQYVELDGALYTIDGGRGADITKGEETVQVLRDGTPGRCTVRVTVEVLDPQQGFSVVGSETHDFLYEQVGERWIFTTFSMVR